MLLILLFDLICVLDYKLIKYKKQYIKNKDFLSQVDAFSYKDMHDIIQAFILADKEDVIDKLQLQQVEVIDH